MPESRDKKADRLLTSGAVKPYRVAPEPMRGVRAHVTGDRGIYDVAVWVNTKGRMTYSCTCEYCEIHPNRQDCSHSLAVSKLV
jgi:hypothetical protein